MPIWTFDRFVTHDHVYSHREPTCSTALSTIRLHRFVCGFGQGSDLPTARRRPE